jgi:hypothetical protein
VLALLELDADVLEELDELLELDELEPLALTHVVGAPLGLGGTAGVSRYE